MCTAATYKTDGFYFGRTLDIDCSYGEEIVVAPRNFPIKLRHGGELSSHYAMVGMAHVAENFPLYYDAANEKGLCIAGLNFVGNARYAEVARDRQNIAVFELIPWLLGTCASVGEAVERFRETNLVGTPFSDRLPTAQLHWLVADRDRAVTVESTADGLHIYENPVGVLTNNPPFPMQLMNLNNFMGLSAKPPENRFSDKLELAEYGRGMGALGLPGDLSPMSRFVRAAFVRQNSKSGAGELESVSQFFHILGAVDQQRGCCELENGQYELTLYTSCASAEKGIYYYTTYENHQISAVDMRRENLDGAELVRFEQALGERISFQN